MISSGSFYTKQMKSLWLLVLLSISHLLVYGQEGSVVLFFQKNEIEVTKNNSLIKKTYHEILINDRFAEEAAKISIPYAKNNKIQDLQAFIKDKHGKIVRTLKKNEITDRSDISGISLYEDNMVREFWLNHSEYPYTICYSYQQEEKEFLYIDHWIPVLDQHIPTISAELRLTVPSNYPISVSQGNIPDPVITTEGNNTIYCWKASYTNLLPVETLSPPIHDYLPYVKIIPQEFKYDKKGSFRDWVSFGNWETALLKGLNDLPDSERMKIDLLVNNRDDQEEVIRALYHYLQDETRYINVSIDKGGLKPYPASYVSVNKFGDCKALTNYMKALLELYHIPSYYTSVYAGENIREIDKEFPSQQFNHVILFIPLEGDTIWLDCTSKGPFNYTGTFTQNRDAFAIAQDNSHFVTTPALSAEEVRCIRNIQVELSGTGITQVTFENSYRGSKFELLSQLEKGVSKNNQKQYIQDYIAGNKHELITYEIVPSNRDDTYKQINFTTHSPHLMTIYGNDMILSAPDLSLPDLEKPDKRVLPLQINYPIYETDTVTYIIPDHLSPVHTLSHHDIENKFGHYKVSYLHGNGELKMFRSLLIHPGKYDPEDYASFFHFINAIKDIQNSSPLLLNQKK